LIRSQHRHCACSATLATFAVPIREMRRIGVIDATRTCLKFGRFTVPLRKSPITHFICCGDGDNSAIDSTRPFYFAVQQLSFHAATWST